MSWTPAVAGAYTITVTATDAGGLKSSQTFNLNVAVDPPPQITSAAPTTVTAGLPYRYDVQATDPNGNYPLTYALAGAPTGLAVDANGRITWSPSIAQIGSYNNITATVTDPYGVSTSQAFSVTVVADTQPPAVSLTFSANPAPVNTTDIILVSATDNVGVTAMTLSVGGVQYPLDSRGFANVPATAIGQFPVVATASDAAGNVGTATATLTVINPNVTGSPTVAITAPTANQIITAPVSITGTVSDANLLSYTITATPLSQLGAGIPTSFQVGQGTTSVTNGTLGTFDPTLLADGSYTLTLSAINTGGKTATASVNVEVAGHLKLGNFTLSATDLTIPVAGIPITVGRSYNTLNGSTSANNDLGPGWQLNYRDVNLKVNFPQGGLSAYSQYPAFQDGTRVDVTLPGGQTAGFTFYGAPESFVGVVDGYKPRFLPDPGVFDQLIAPDADMLLIGGYYVTITGAGLVDYNPADPIIGNVYNLKTPDKRDYVIVASTGQLNSVSDRNNNTLTFDDTGIYSNTGRAVTFTRDPQGHITAVTDPRGNSVQYDYDINGYLASVTDRAGNITAEYTYSTGVGHQLTTVTDALGVHQATASYGSDGRLSQITDANGNSLNMGYNTTNLTQTITDPQAVDPNTGQASPATSTVQFDARGNATQTTDGVGTVTKATYTNDLPTTVTKVAANGQQTTTQATYDDSGNVLTST
ncbi:MAG: putative Ig domain-containing protein, partial [Acidimicrobiales bacterium]